MAATRVGVVLASNFTFELHSCTAAKQKQVDVGVGGETTKTTTGEREWNSCVKIHQQQPPHRFRPQALAWWVEPTLVTAARRARRHAAAKKRCRDEERRLFLPGDDETDGMCGFCVKGAVEVRASLPCVLPSSTVNDKGHFLVYAVIAGVVVVGVFAAALFARRSHRHRRYEQESTHVLMSEFM
jgi:hypothetical protein